MKESMKDDLSMMCNIATRVSTLILVVNVVLFKVVFRTEFSMSGDDILAILLIGLISGLMMIPVFIFRNVGKIAMLVLRSLYFIGINVMVLWFGTRLHWFNLHNAASFAVMETMILGIYILVTILNLTLDYREASAINRMLDSRKNR